MPIFNGYGNFEDRNKKAILNQIEDPHAKDVANITFTIKDCLYQTAVCVTSGVFYSACAALLELGDHTSGLVCYAGCSAFMGYASYRGFRKVWQEVSIPLKDYVLSFFVTKS